MGLEKIIEIVKLNMAVLPHWATEILAHLIAVILLVYLLTVLFKAATQTAFIGPIRTTWSFLVNVTKSILKSTLAPLKSPIDRPRSKLVILLLNLVMTYMMCLLFFFFFVVFALLFIFAGLPQHFVHQLACYGILIFFMYFTIFFRAEADRDWLIMKAQWQLVMSRSRESAAPNT